MSLDVQNQDANVLRQMSYSELKQVAKKNGVKGNMKAEKIISILTKQNDESIQGFSTPGTDAINSPKENLEDKFNRDMLTPLETPRRGTFTISTPNSELIEAVSSESPLHDLSNITIHRGSDRKLRSCRMNLNSLLKSPPDVNRISGAKKVSFSTSRTKHKKSEVSYRTTPHPKSKRSMSKSRINMNATETPIQLQGQVSPAADKEQVGKTDTYLDDTETHVELPVQVPSTDMKEQVAKLDTSMDIAETHVELPAEVPSAIVKEQIVKSDSVKKLQSARKLKSKTTPTSVKKFESSKKLKARATPNFKKIHERAFEKMESIDDYQRRKENSVKKLQTAQNRITKAKSKIPVAFSGIPFIPSRTRSYNKLVENSGVTESLVSENKKQMKVKKEKDDARTKVLKKNNSSRNKKFDLQASLSRKLGYKPYTGPLKPLTESNVNISTSACTHKPKDGTKKVVENKRNEARTLLQGVRVNKRFELQMKNRKLN